MYGSCTGSNVIPLPNSIYSKQQRLIQFGLGHTYTKERNFFCAVSYGLHDSGERHSQIRLSIVNKIINEWEYYEDFIMELSKTNSSDDYKNVLSRGKEYSESFRLKCISLLYSNYLLRVHYENCMNNIDYDYMYSVLCAAFCTTHIHIM